MAVIAVTAVTLIMPVTSALGAADLEPIRDLQDVDPDIHRSLIWVLENDVAEVSFHPALGTKALAHHCATGWRHDFHCRLRPAGRDDDARAGAWGCGQGGPSRSLVTMAAPNLVAYVPRHTDRACCR